MSERGSFVTQNLWRCNRCCSALMELLTRLAPWVNHRDVPPVLVNGGIVAGYVSGSAAGDEWRTFDLELRDEIEAVICHPVRIAVVCDDERQDAFFTFEPRRASE